MPGAIAVCLLRSFGQEIVADNEAAPTRKHGRRALEELRRGGSVQERFDRIDGLPRANVRQCQVIRLNKAALPSRAVFERQALSQSHTHRAEGNPYAVDGHPRREVKQRAAHPASEIEHGHRTLRRRCGIRDGA